MKFFATFDGKQHRVMFKHWDGGTLAVMSINVNGVWIPIEDESAICSSLDQYNKWFGRKLALTRLTKKIQSKEARKAIWNAYFDAAAQHLLRYNFVNHSSNSNILNSYNKLAEMWKEIINPKCKSVCSE